MIRSKKAFIFTGLTFFIILLLLTLNYTQNVHDSVRFSSQLQESEKFNLDNFVESISIYLFHSSDVSLHNALSGIVLEANYSNMFYSNEGEFIYSLCQLYLFGGYNLSNMSSPCTYYNGSSTWIMINNESKLHVNYSLHNLLNYTYPSFFGNTDSDFSVMRFYIDQHPSNFDQISFNFEYKYSRNSYPFIFKDFEMYVDKNISHLIVPYYSPSNDYPKYLKYYPLETIYSLNDAPSLLDRFLYKNISTVTSQCFGGASNCGFCFESECDTICNTICPASGSFNSISLSCDCT